MHIRDKFGNEQPLTWLYEQFGPLLPEVIAKLRAAYDAIGKALQLLEARPL